MPHLCRSALRGALALSCALPILACAPAAAQQTAAPFAAAPAGVETTLDEISVAATGVPTPTAQVGSSVTVLTERTLEQQQRRTVPDALQQVPGLNVVQTGGPGGQTSVFIRGANSNHTKVLIDGIDATDPSNGNGSFDFGQLLTDDLARIEVLRGPQSGLYGSDAIGGVISFTTKRGEGPARASLRLEGGSFGTFNQSGRISGAENGFDYSVSVAHFRAAATPVTPPDLVPFGRPIHPNFYDNETVSAKFGYQFTDTFRINSVTRFINSRLLLTGDDFSTFPAAPAAFRSEAAVQQIFTRNEAEWTPFAGFHNILAINYSNLFNRQQGPLDPLATPDGTTGLGERTRFEYRGDYLLSPGNIVLFGAQRDEESLFTTSPGSVPDSLRARNGNTAGYGEVQLTPFNRAFLVANLRHDENDQFGPATTFRVAPSYILPFTDTRLKGSVGTGFKAPTLSQLYQSFPAFNFFANPNLKPEESLGYDAGFEQPLGDRVLVGATYYRNDFTNLINTNASFTSNENVGKAVSYGAEAFASVRFTETLSGRVDYTNTVTKNEITNQELLRRPRHKGSATAFWNPSPGLSFSGTVIVLGSFVDGNRDFSVPRLKNPGFTLVNLAVNYDVSETVSVFGRIDNLFDRRYENPTGFLGPGLAVYGGVRLTSF
ncbi:MULTISPECIES: TonB-dependent receptor plug domain-containing protein [Methylorubrum]|uniref:TonB-dependent receptor plug domain-containing protein n=1 Tax=Methylorubrum TaxID=2282523 RepID=UPI0020A0B58F|nr:vitamin B12 transporter [Methylorubrum zatmanii]MCP1555826.1 vitamin B12 transporter [Methylorubrum extorquens]MCP1577861.1 vitamin B12 transporter [Methylorubrum extorquens]